MILLIVFLLIGALMTGTIGFLIAPGILQVILKIAFFIFLPAFIISVIFHIIRLTHIL